MTIYSTLLVGKNQCARKGSKITKMITSVQVTGFRTKTEPVNDIETAGVTT